jgi:cell division GTPase FtsZ
MEIISNSRAASDTRHRIQDPNSHRRAIKVVGLGAGGARVAASVGVLGFNDVQIVIPGDGATAADALQPLNDADMIFVVACAGDNLELAPLIKQIGRQHGVLITGILIQQAAVPPAQTGLEVLRAASDMLVIATDDSYVADMLTELGA